MSVIGFGERLAVCILVNGTPFKDTMTSNYLFKGRIGGKIFGIIVDGEGTLMSFLRGSEISRVAGRYEGMLTGDLPFSFDWLENIHF